MSNYPAKITFVQLREAMTALGLKPDTKNLRSITVEPGVVTVVRNRVDDMGRNFVVAYERTGTEVVEIAVVSE
jgi:hypothetical protein